MKHEKSKIRILVVDDHKVLRHGLISLLEENELFEIIGEAGNGKETLKFLDEYTVDIVLLDVEMPVMNGNETLKNILEKHPHVKVIMFTMHHTLGYESYFLQAGAKAYLAKNSDFELIYDSIINVYNNEVVSDINDIVDSKISDEHLQVSLSEIEQDVLKLICKNNHGEEICRTLDISNNTLKYYRKSIYTKTRTNSLSELIIYAIKQGIISVK